MGNHVWCYVECSPSEKTLEEIKKDCLKTVEYYSNLDEKDLAGYSDSGNYIKFLKEYIRINRLPEKFDYSMAHILCDLVGYGSLTWVDGKWYKPVDPSKLRDPFKLKEKVEPNKYFVDPEKLINWLKKRDDVSYYSTKDDKTRWGVTDELENRIRKIFKEFPGLLIMP